MPRLIIKHGAKHMSGAVDGEDACLELPEVIEKSMNAIIVPGRPDKDEHV